MAYLWMIIYLSFLIRLQKLTNQFFCLHSYYITLHTHTPFTSSVRAMTMCEFQAHTLFHYSLSLFYLSKTYNGSFKLWRSLSFTLSSFSYPLQHKRLVCASLLSMFPMSIASLFSCFKLYFFYFFFICSLLFFDEDQLPHCLLSSSKLCSFSFNMVLESDLWSIDFLLPLLIFC